MNKSFVTNSVALIVCVIGFTLSPGLSRELALGIGLFALSGAITNWLAIYMLFEKVPFLYGSGVIPNRFEAFKSSIENMIMGQFFSEENLERFIHQLGGQSADFPTEKILNTLDWDVAFQALIDAIMGSQFGGMLGMFGGEAALQPLKQPFEEKMKSTLINMTQSESFKQSILEQLENSVSVPETREMIHQVVLKRLEELTPQMVKEIVQKMIREHLGWLVVWGGVFGGLIGLITALVRHI
ncbi:MAG: DUF445 domain-containing protein [Lentisphaeria bacterium]|nr:DUF445 domain-containing protein [Lentisphaeria bacterium]